MMDEAVFEGPVDVALIVDSTEEAVDARSEEYSGECVLGVVEEVLAEAGVPVHVYVAPLSSHGYHKDTNGSTGSGAKPDVERLLERADTVRQGGGVVSEMPAGPRGCCSVPGSGSGMEGAFPVDGFPCADEEVVIISRHEFEALSRGGYGDVLMRLGADRADLDQDVLYSLQITNRTMFVNLGIPAWVLNIIRSCVRSAGEGELWEPIDAGAEAAVHGGELRHWADVLGGFPSVDKALKHIAEKRERRSRIAELHQFRRATTPIEDTMGLFEWKVVCLTSPVPLTQGVTERQDEGYEVAGMCGVFVYMRRARENPMLEGLTDLLGAREAGEDGEATEL